MTNPTPGPWEFRITPIGGRPYVSIPHEARTAPMVVFVNDADREANCRLIAAAPDLLDAAESVVGMLYGVLCQEYGHPDTWPADRAGVQGYRQLRGAIAKARGRQP